MGSRQNRRDHITLKSDNFFFLKILFLKAISLLCCGKKQKRTPYALLEVSSKYLNLFFQLNLDLGYWNNFQFLLSSLKSQIPSSLVIYSLSLIPSMILLAVRRILAPKPLCLSFFIADLVLEGGFRLIPLRLFCSCYDFLVCSFADWHPMHNQPP